MDDNKILAERFAGSRTRLRSIAYRMLGSASEAEDAVQEAWLRLMRAEGAGVENLTAWLTTVVARICLDMLRARKSRREEPLGAEVDELPAAGDAEQDKQIADSVGVAMLVVLETLPPAERVAFVLHDMFDLSFDAIAPVVGRSPAAARQLASRGRRAPSFSPMLRDRAGCALTRVPIRAGPADLRRPVPGRLIQRIPPGIDERHRYERNRIASELFG